MVPESVPIADLLRVGTIFASLGVVATPILYPKYSFFVVRAKQGLDQLTEIKEEHGDVRLCYVEKGDPGFDQLLEVADFTFDVETEPERICLAIGTPKDLGQFTGLGMEYGIGDNGVLYVESSSGEPELLRWDGWNPKSTLQLEKFRRGVRLRAQERSHFVTIVLAVLWTTLSVVLVV